MKKMMMALGCANLKRRGSDKNGEWNFVVYAQFGCIWQQCAAAGKYFFVYY